MKMTLTSNYPTDFIEYLKRLMRLYVYTEFPVLKLYRIQLYMKNELHISNTPKSIAIMAVNNLKSRGYVNGKIEITISNTLLLPGTDENIIDLCKMMNFGTADVPGYPIFTEMFNYFESHAEELYAVYKKL